jgi:hypothetical protein
MKTKRDLDGRSIKTKRESVWRDFGWWGLILIIGVCAYRYWSHHPISASSEVQLSDAISARYERSIQRQQNLWIKEKTKFTDEMAQAQKQKLRAAMLESSVSASEVDGLWKSFDKATSTKTKFNPHGAVYNKEIYLWPHYVEKGFVGANPVWVFVCGWELQSWTSKGDAVPGHFWHIVLDSKAPYKQLYSQNCS